jgi:hypothetical protein
MSRDEPCQIGGIGEIVRFENVRDHKVVGKAGDGFLRGGLVRIGRGRYTRSSTRALGSAAE